MPKYKIPQKNKKPYPNFIKMIEERNFDLFISSFREIHPQNVFQCAFIYTQKPQEKLSVNEDAVFVYDNKIWFSKIEEIIKIVINGEEAGFIKGRVYLQKQDLLELHEKIQECTDDDLFLTEQTKWFFCRELKKKVLVYNLNDIIYNNVDSKPGSYHTRSEFNIESKKFLIPVEEWATECICKKLFDTSQGYIQCDRCQRWIHHVCSGLSQDIIENLGDHNFNCSICVGEMKVEKIKQKQNENKNKQQYDHINDENQIIEENLQIQKQERKPLQTKKLLNQSLQNKSIVNQKNFKKPNQKMKSK